MRTLSTSILARNGHPSNHKFKALAVLRAYFDESGHEANTDSVAITGIVASSDEWDKFDVAWREQLAVPKVEYFHAVECEHRDKIFSNLSLPLRDSLRWGLGDVIAQSPISIVNGGIQMEGWKRQDLPKLKKIFPSPWHLCFAYVLQQLDEWSKENANGEPIALVFSEQQQYKQHAHKIYDAYMRIKDESSSFVSLQFADMRLFPGLQAADFVSYEIYQNTVRGITKEEQVERIAMKRLLLGKATKFTSEFDPYLWRQLYLEENE
jgi:Protein of unknown function (DUF3800)